MATSSFYKSSGSTPAVENSIEVQVTAAATSAATAATKADEAAVSALDAANSLSSFQQYYLGAYSSAPSTTQVGSLYFSTATNQLFVFDGVSWQITNSANALQNTDGLTEGVSNLYHTDERVDDRVNALLTAGSNITLTYDDVANTLTIASTASGGGGSSNVADFTDLSDVPQSYTGYANQLLRVNAAESAVEFILNTTDYITEGNNNLYFTNARATTAITGSDLDMGGNKVLFGNVYSAEGDLPSASTYHGLFAHVHATGKGYFAHAGSWHKLLDETSSNTDDLTEGTSNLYFTDERVDDRVNALLTAGSNITLTYDDAANTLTIASTASGGSGSSTFTGLTDTPSTMGTAGQYLAVNSGGTALEFVAAPSGGSGGSSTFTGLSDTPSSFTASKFVAVNSGGTALEYVNALTPSGLTVTNNAASGGGSLSYVPSGSGNTATLSFTPPDLSGYATTSSLSSYATTASLATVATSGAYGDLSGTPSLATVATSGAYGDLSGTPNLSGYATATSTTTFTNKSGNISQWTNDSGYLTGITGQSLYSLSNVNTSSSPSDGQVLTWDNANSYWTPTTVSSGTSISYLASTSTSAATTNNKAKSLALGSGATVGSNVTDNGIAIGHNANLVQGRSIMIGNDQDAQYQSTIIAATESSVSSGSGQVSTIVGDNYKVTGVNRSGVTLLGAATAGTNYSTALGYMADAQHEYSVALGFDATTTTFRQLMLGSSGQYDSFTSVRVGNPSYTPSNAKDLTTKDYVDGLAPTAFSGTVQSSTGAINLFNLGAYANYDGGEIVIVADTTAAKQIAKIIFTHQNGAPVFTTYAQITTGSTAQFATFGVVQNSTNLNLTVQQNTGGNVPCTASVTYL